MEVSVVGLGAWAIGGADYAYGWGAQDDAASIATIRAALDAGINWIDTAAVYGLGHSEEVVAAALDGVPDADRPYVFTKGGLVWSSDRAVAPRRVGDPASLRREVQESLRRLRRERIDLYQMHWPAEDGAALDDYWEAFCALRDEGLIAAAGLSNHDIRALDAAEAIGHVDAVQPPLSAIRQDAAATVLPWAAAHGTGAIVYSPMGSGLLTGRFDRAGVDALAEDDWRKRSPDFTSELERNLAIADALRVVAERYDATMAAVAVAWTLANPGVTGAIVGARHPEQIAGWIGAVGLQLDEADLAQVAAAKSDA